MRSRIKVKKLKNEIKKMKYERGDIIGFSQILQKRVSCIIKEFDCKDKEILRKVNAQICREIDTLIIEKFI